MDVEDLEPAEATAVAAAVRQFLTSRVRSAAQVDDLTQETLLRVLEVRDRLGREVSIPYAVTVAKHLVVAEARSAAIAQRHVHKLAGEPAVPAPDDAVLSRDDEAALRVALEALPHDDRALLVAHVVDGTDTASLAARTGGTAGGVAARLARTRARARVDYVVASNRATLPTMRCRPVLLSLSAADLRRQKSTHAAEHLVECRVCADLSPQLVERRRSIVGLVLPIPILARAFGAVRAFLRGHPVVSIGGSLGVIAVAAVVVVAAATAPHHQIAISSTSTARPTITAAPTPTDLDVRTLLAVSPAKWPQLTGRRVVSRAIPILSVPADEGFWIGFSTTRRIWVQLATHGESPFRVVAGRRATFRGEITTHGAGFAARVGVGEAEGGRQLTNARAHLTIDAAKLVTS